MTRRRRAVAVALALACGAANAGAQLTPLPTLKAAVEAARHDAARRVAAAGTGATIEVGSAESVTWSDGAIGCPREGMRYTHSLVNGYRVQLRVGGETWDYHATVRGGLMLCPEGRAKAPRPRTTD